MMVSLQQLQQQQAIHRGLTSLASTYDTAGSLICGRGRKGFSVGTATHDAGGSSTGAGVGAADGIGVTGSITSANL